MVLLLKLEKIRAQQAFNSSGKPMMCTQVSCVARNIVFSYMSQCPAVVALANTTRTFSTENQLGLFDFISTRLDLNRAQ